MRLFSRKRKISRVRTTGGIVFSTGGVDFYDEGVDTASERGTLGVGVAGLLGDGVAAAGGVAGFSGAAGAGVAGAAGGAGAAVLPMDEGGIVFSRCSASWAATAAAATSAAFSLFGGSVSSFRRKRAVSVRLLGAPSAISVGLTGSTVFVPPSVAAASASIASLCARMP